MLNSIRKRIASWGAQHISGCLTNTPSPMPPTSSCTTLCPVEKWNKPQNPAATCTRHVKRKHRQLEPPESKGKCYKSPSSCHTVCITHFGSTHTHTFLPCPTFPHESCPIRHMSWKEIPLPQGLVWRGDTTKWEGAAVALLMNSPGELS